MASLKTPRKTSKNTIAVAFSGGLDSTVLLHAAIAVHGAKQVMALHIHHGIQKQADQWQQHCQTIAKQWGCHFATQNVQLQQQGNVEAQARNLRYEALINLCEQHGITNLLIAHHQDDQAETVLLQLLRGAGLPGLSAMPVTRQAKNKQQTIHIWRPFLELTRKDLESYAKEHQLTWIEDPSNADQSYRRNALRKSLLPKLEAIQPGATANLARSAKHITQAQELLNQLADIDLGLIQKDDHLSKTNLLRLYKTHQGRANNAIRRWLNLNSLSYPSEERLQAWWQDLQSAKADATIQWNHDDALIRIWRDRITLEPATQEAGQWVFKTLKANSKQPGIDKKKFDQLKKKGLINLMDPIMGEKFKVDAKRPRKTLKNLLQENDIPPWQRQAPVLYIGDEPVAVAGIGISADWVTLTGPRISPQWLPNV